MITPGVDQTDWINWLIGLALVVLLAVQLWLLMRQSLPQSRKWLRAGLNGLLWLILTGYFLQIHWQIPHPATHALLAGDEVPASVARSLADSLHIPERFNARTFKATYDSVTLVGQDFPVETLTSLSRAAVQWVPYDQSNQLQTIGWKGIVQLGEMQHVTGRIQSNGKQTLTIRYGTQRLDSVRLPEGINTFMLQFPAFAQGQTETELVLGQTVLDTIRFFARPARPINVRFLLDSPDFESKTLADWLGKHGHIVELSTTLSKNISSTVNINKAGKATAKTPDLLITDPANAGDALVRKAITEGKAVLFINLADPEADSRRINQALGSRWQVRKISNEALVPVGPNLNALPYRFADGLNQFPVPGYPVAVQQTAGRVGVSLLSETFPLSLSGDSVTYNRIWTATLARLQPASNGVYVDAPVFRGLPTTIRVNTLTTPPPRMQVGQDTVQLVRSALNEHSAQGFFRPNQSGWQPVQDSLALYVEPITADDPIAGRRLVSQFLLAHSRYPLTLKQAARQTEAQIPNWVWLMLFVTCLTALWIEPKL